MALIQHERIITTVEKAKEVRPFVEKLITLAKKGTIHAKRLALAKLGPMGHARPLANEEDEAKHDDRKIIKKLFDEIGPRFKDRPGGYTRIIKRHERRLGDGGRTAFLELLKEGEVKVRAKAPAAGSGPGRGAADSASTGGRHAATGTGDTATAGCSGSNPAGSGHSPRRNAAGRILNRSASEERISQEATERTEKEASLFFLCSLCCLL